MPVSGEKAAEAARNPKNNIPRVLCPMCSKPMRLSTIEPRDMAADERMTFQCDCGFEYRASPAVAAERAL
jgi:hypothetical protein